MTGSLVSRFNDIIHLMLHVIMYSFSISVLDLAPHLVHTICSLSMSYVRSDIFI